MKKGTALAVLLLLAPFVASAHQPRLAVHPLTVVSLPDISKAYYGTLAGAPDIYRVTASSSFPLYVNILLPDITGVQKDVTATIIKDGDAAHPLATLGGSSTDWKPMFEPFGHDNYLQGPEYRAQADAGVYDIIVSSTHNNSAYSLAIGETESFGIAETINALVFVPQLKRDFFLESPISFILSPFGIGYIVVMFLFAFAFGFAYRATLKQLAARTPRGLGKNIGAPDRWLRFAIAAALLLWAITTTWSPWLLFFSGFALFESIFSWCGFYAALGKTTCPV